MERTDYFLSRADDQPFQFGLRHLFLFTTVAAVYCAVERLTGPLPPMLVLGLVVVATGVRLLRIENLLVGALVGTGLALAVVVLVQVLMGTQSWTTALLLFSYPLAGYGIGMSCAADRGFKIG